MSSSDRQPPQATSIAIAPTAGGRHEPCSLEVPTRAVDDAVHSGLRLSNRMRWLALMSGVALLALMATACALQPSSRGLGTHQQLGLPPCTSIVVFGVPCPTCGMTTSWSLFVRGRWQEAAQVNAGGLLLALIALAYIPASCYFFLWGRASQGGWFSLTLACGLMTALVIALVQWGLRQFA